jgi:hypothetical protein
MLKVYGIVRIESVKAPRQISAKGWVIDLTVLSKSHTKKDGELDIRDDTYEASMVLQEGHVDFWKDRLVAGLKLFIRDAEFEGFTPQPDGSKKGWVKVRLGSSVRDTIILD